MTEPSSNISSSSSSSSSSSFSSTSSQEASAEPTKMDPLKHLDCSLVSINPSSYTPPPDIHTMVLVQALNELKGERGSTEESILGYIEANFPHCDQEACKLVLRRLVEEGHVLANKCENSPSRYVLLRDSGTPSSFPWALKPMEGEEYWKLMHSMNQELQQQSGSLWMP